jgi:hypothetical protein
MLVGQEPVVLAPVREYSDFILTVCPSSQTIQ